MGKQFRITLAVGIGISIGALVWMIWPQREPVYQGKSLSFWMDQYQTNFSSPRDAERTLKREQAQAAIREIGTNALPALLGMVGRKDSVLKSRLLALAARQSVIPMRVRNADYYHARSSYGFGALRTLAKSAVPALIKLLHDENAEVRATAARSLGFIGADAEPAIPDLLPLLDERNEGLPILAAMDALGFIHKRPEIVIPALLRFLNGDRKDWNYAGPAMFALRFYGEEAKYAVPMIEEYLHHPDADKRDAALNALIRIDREAADRAVRTMPRDE